ncbi:calpain-3-like [Lineus longissimus]|uniref:calpain-3-like n=1 Tax=Lineus longissimus TaxID=88925 RepID=UPI002B4FB2D0
MFADGGAEDPWGRSGDPWAKREASRRRTLKRYYDKRNRDEDDDGPTESEIRKPVPRPERVYDDAKKAEAMKEAFYQLAGEDKVIDAYELKAILNAAFKKDFPFDGFSNEHCRSLVALMDVDESGALDVDEFIALWDHLKKWKGYFEVYDIDSSGNMSAYELKNALRDLGFYLSGHILKLIIMRYRRRNSNVEFDDFILLCCRLQSTFDTIEAMKNAEGKVEMDYDLFMKTALFM